MLLAGLALAVGGALLWWWLQPMPAPQPAEPAAGDWPPRLPASQPRPAPAAPAEPARSPVRAALLRAFHDRPPDRATLEALAKGEVGSIAERLARDPSSAAAAELSDLERLCRDLAGASTAAGALEEQRAIQLAGGADAGARAVIEAGLVQAHEFRTRFAAGCAAARLDREAVRARLEASAAAGDPASLERLAEQDPAPLARLQSAALLGNARAQYLLAQALYATQPLGARSWLESAARGDADAEAYLGACQLSGCFGSADPAAARRSLESAARRGALYALGALGSAEAAGAPHRWAAADAPVVPVAPRAPDVLGLDAAQNYAWAALDAALARDGCFGFEFGIAAEALDGAERLERALRPAELDAARRAADALEAADGAAARRALGCD